MPGDWQKLFRYASAGTEFVATFALAVLAGVLADRHWRTTPLWTLVGSLAGFALALFRLVRVTMRAQRRSGKDDDGRKDSP